MTVPLKDVYDELQFVSDRISTQVRTIAIGVLALVWLFLAGGADAPALPIRPDAGSLLGMAALALGVLLSDYLQYLFGYWGTSAVRKKAEEAGKDTAEYVYTDLRYRARLFFFWGKQVLTLIVASWLIITVLRSLLSIKALPN